MNTAHLLAATLALGLAAGSALAQEASVAPLPASGTASRASVQAEAHQAVLSGALHEAEQLDTLRAARVGLLTRAEVRAETLQALHSGEIDRINLEAHGFERSGGHRSSTLRVAGAAR